MDYLIEILPPGARVLDLGASSGSFRTPRTDLTIVRLDVKIPPERAHGQYVRGDSARLPFAPGSFQLIISNHSMEHFPDLRGTLREVARILRPDGVLYVAVPDTSTLTDRIYRWLAYGGGHVNPFYSAQEVISLVEGLTGLPHRATRELYSSLSFLNRRNLPSRPPRRMALFAYGDERFLAVFTWLLRLLDRTFGTRLSHYGWSFYFGAVETPKVLEPWINVCVRCGSGHSEDYLRETGAVSPIPGVFDAYLCPSCGAPNRFTRVNL